MSGDKIFGSTLLGYDKADVSAYMDKLVKDFEGKLREKEEEINLLRLQNRDLKDKNEDFLRSSQNSVLDKNKIVEVLLKAQEKADSMREEVRRSTENERKGMEESIEKESERLRGEFVEEHEKIQRVKGDLEKLRKDALMLMDKLNVDLSDVIGVYEPMKEMAHKNEGWVEQNLEELGLIETKKEEQVMEGIHT